MEAIIIGLGVTLSLTGILYWWKRDRAKELEERQLQMFLDTLIWNPDDMEYEIQERVEIKTLPEKKEQ
jgi:hypothetical protein